MGQKLVDVTMHIDEEIDAQAQEQLRGDLLQTDGVEAAAFSRDKPHLLMIEYDPARVDSTAFVDIAGKKGLHAELVGM